MNLRGSIQPVGVRADNFCDLVLGVELVKLLRWPVSLDIL